MQLSEYLQLDYEHLLNAANRITGNNPLAADLLHYAIEEVSYKENLSGILDSGGARFYLVRIMLNNWRSQTSPFYKQFVKNQPIPEDLEISETEAEQLDINRVNQILDELTWYEKELFKLYAEGEHNYSTLARATGIPRTSIGLTIKRVRNHIKKNL